MKTISQPTKEELPQKGNTPGECQQVSFICAINDLEAKLNGVCIEDFIKK